jgi:TrkA domain protein
MTGMDVTEVLLPGVGLRYEFTTHEGDRFGCCRPPVG